jgi:hypothetical protein
MSVSEQTKKNLYKVGYIELSSYCKSLPIALSEVFGVLDKNKIGHAYDCLNSLMLGLSFVLEDIHDIEEKINKE